MTVTRWGIMRTTGIAAILAGSIFVAIQPIHPPDVLASVSTPLWAIIISLKLAMCLLFLIGLSGLYACQIEQAGWPGLIGFALLFFSFWLQTAFIFVELLVLPVLTTAAPEFIDSYLGIINGSPGEMDVSAIVALYAGVGISYLLGGVLFGIASFRASVLPRGPALLMALSAIITPLAALSRLHYSAMPLFRWDYP